MKNIGKLIALCLTLSFVMTSCYDDNEYWLDENIKSGGSYLPVIQNLSTEGTPSAGATIDLNLQYWSRDAISSIDFFATVNDVESAISSVGDAGSFDPVSEAKILSQAYTIPTDTSVTEVSFRAVITTVNNLTRERTTSVSISE